MLIGMEMFPRSSQQPLDDYTQKKLVNESEFIKRSGYFKVWGYDYRLYREIINFARVHQIPIIGLNVEKEIPRLLFHSGSTDVFTVEQQKAIPQERDLTLPMYRERIYSAFSMHQARQRDKGFGGFLQAQVIWDETMAETVVISMQNNPEKKIIVIAGTGHVDKQNGIPPRVTRRINKLSQVVVVPLKNPSQLASNILTGDFFIPTEPLALSPAGKLGIILHQTDKTKVTLVKFSPHGKAERSGLQKGDIIQKINTTPVATIADIKRALLDQEPGDVVGVTVTREGFTKKFEVELSGLNAGRIPPNHPR